MEKSDFNAHLLSADLTHSSARGRDPICLPEIVMPEPISVVVADGHTLTSVLLVDALCRQRQFRMVRFTSSCADVFNGPELDTVEVALLRVSLADEPLSGFRVLRKIRSDWPHLKVVALLDHEDSRLVFDLFRLGVKGIFCTQNPDFHLLCKCVERVHAGEIWASNHQLQWLVSEVETAFAGPPPLQFADARGTSILSKREGEVVACVTNGLSNRETAHALGLTEHTVKNYLFRIFDKLGISSRTELIVYAMSHFLHARFLGPMPDRSAIETASKPARPFDACPPLRIPASPHPRPR